MNERDLDNLFDYHAPVGTQPISYAEIRKAAKAFAAVIVQHTPQSKMRDDAVMLVHSAVMKANASIATDGQF